MLRSTIKPIALILFIILLYSCEQEEIHITQIEKGLPEIVQDTVYTDAELTKILEEELEIIKLEKEGYIMDVSEMNVEKDNPKKVYVHYMPWFQSKSYDGYWGQHWTMTNQNPENIDASGKRDIASYYYPVIGPYSSNDPNLHEYHFLMMKLAGVDGVIFDWYGSKDLHDYGKIKTATETFIATLEDLGLKFSIMYEDRVADQAVNQQLSPNIINAVQEDFSYINDTYFSSPEYLKYNNKNLLFIFGPQYITTENQWNDIFDVLPSENRPEFLTIWGTNNLVGQHASGEFLWVDQDHLLAHQNYYSTYDVANMTTVGSSYPGFKSFYQDGGWSDGINEWSIDHYTGYTFAETLNYTHHELSDFIQIITWNDFGEGTMIEPTNEFGFTYLQLLQEYTGVAFTPRDLQVALELYETRKLYKDNEEVQSYLNQTYIHIKNLNLKRADKIIKAVKRFFAI